jgi:hypothetical protein
MPVAVPEKLDSRAAASGDKALVDATRAVSISQDGIGVDVDPNYALTVSGNKVQVVVKAAGGIELTDGALDIPEHADGGLNHREDGRLGVEADSSRGPDTDTDGVFARLKTSGGLAFDSGEIAHDLGTATQGQLVTDVTGENLGTQDAADLFGANGHLVATAGKRIKHTTPGAFAYSDETNARGFHGIGLDANGHVRWYLQGGAGGAWASPCGASAGRRRARRSRAQAAHAMLVAAVTVASWYRRSTSRARTPSCNCPNPSTDSPMPSRASRNHTHHSALPRAYGRWKTAARTGTLMVRCRGPWGSSRGHVPCRTSSEGG